MQNIERLPTLEGRATLRWQRVLLETVLACGGALVITGIIGVFHLYPRIPNISILYLLVILTLASIFGRYAALLASIIAFLSFDFFLVPPLYTFTIDRWEEWIALFVFLATALLTSQLAVVTRQSAARARARERDARILYELIRITNMHEHLEDQLQAVVLAIVRVFASWGVQACALLLPNTEGTLQLVADAPLTVESFALSPQERAQATTVMTQGKMIDSPELPQGYRQTTAESTPLSTSHKARMFLRLIPLKIGDQVFGVLCLRIQNPMSWFDNETRIKEEQARPNSRIDFFWTFLEQATSLIERGRLRSTVIARDE
jgi:two-component system sensor histidine kinase KdpD